MSEEDRTWIIRNTSCMIPRHLSGQVGKQTAMLGFGRGHERLNLKHTVLRDEPFNFFFLFPLSLMYMLFCLQKIESIAVQS